MHRYMGEAESLQGKLFKVEKVHKSGVRAWLSKKDVQNMMHFKEAKVVRQD